MIIHRMGVLGSFYGSFAFWAEFLGVLGKILGVLGVFDCYFGSFSSMVSPTS